MSRPVDSTDAGRFAGGGNSDGTAGREKVVQGWDMAVGRSTRTGTAQTPAEKPIRLAQSAVPMPGVPMAPPVTPHFIPGTKENKAVTEPLARHIWRNVPEIADSDTLARRTRYLGHELGQGHVGTVAGHLFLGRSFPDHVENPPETFPAQDHKPVPLVTPIPDQKKAEPLTTPIPEQQKAEPVGGGFQPAKPDIKNEGLTIPKPPVDTTILEARGKPDGLPPGTLPIDQAKTKFGISRESVHAIKRGIQAGPTDWVGIDRDGNVWTGDENNQGENHGPYHNLLP